MFPAGEQRSIIAGGIGTSRGQPFGYGPRVKTAIDKSTLPEVILKMVFGHSSYHDWHFAAHHTVPVSYTHLDVYKRQDMKLPKACFR